MKGKLKYYCIAAVAFIALGVGIIGLGRLLGGKTKNAFSFSGTGKNGDITVFSKDDLRKGSEKLEEFDSIKVETASIDVFVEEGDAFGIEYYVFDGLQPEISTSGKTVTVKQPSLNFSINVGFFSEESNYYKITVPKGHKFESVISTSSGEIDVNVSETYGKLSSSSGDIKFGNSEGADLSVNTSSGSIELYEAAFDELTVKSTSGDCSLKECKAEAISISSSSGEIEMDDIDTEKLEIGTTSGDITVKDTATGLLKTETSSGEANIRLNAVEEINCKSTSGDVNLELPGDEGDYTYDLKCTSGDITVDGNEMSHKYSTKHSGKPIEITTSSGSIEIEF